MHYSKKIKYISTSIVSIIFFIVLLSFTKVNPFGFSKNIDMIRLITPQGYAFFTRSPREPQFIFYHQQNSSLIRLNQKSSINIKDFFGLNRSNRRYSLFLGRIISNRNKWSILKNSESMLNSNYNDTIRVGKDFLLKKGTYYVLKYETIPWAWARNLSKPKGKYIKILLQ